MSLVVRWFDLVIMRGVGCWCGYFKSRCECRLWCRTENLMFDTLIGVVVLLAFVLPGFIVAQLAESLSLRYPTPTLVGYAGGLASGCDLARMEKQ